MRFLSVMLLTVSSSVFAYVPSMGGSGGGGSACVKPKFSNFMPEEKAEVKPGAAFSFIASPNTHLNSIKVEVKAIPVKLDIPTKDEKSYKISGKLPENLKNTFVRIVVTGQGSSQCKGSDGWLVKITE
ncbi:MAG: hypothetical protein HOP02_11120 [Methylococcaceae bacterium]|nr:hypothetical protein [Methylococcaceae bacterium]